MQHCSFDPIRGSSLPPSFHEIRLELARSAGYPEGCADIGYVIVAPLDPADHIDAAVWKSYREACRVTRLRPREDDVRGHLVHRPGGIWAFHYDVDGSAPDEAGFHFENEAFRRGEYVSLRERETMHTYRVASVTRL